MRTWDQWMTALPADRAAQAAALLQLMQDANCPDPHSWVRSEIDEEIPQAARYRFLRTLWPDMIDSWRNIETCDAARPLLEQGVDRDQLVRVAREVAYETVFAMLYHLGDDKTDDDDPVSRLPMWRLVEVDAAGRDTGRPVDALYEDLLGMDPSGTDGADIVRYLPGPWHNTD